MNAADMIRVEVVSGAESTTVRVPRGTKVADIEDTLRHVLNLPRRAQIRMGKRNLRRRDRLQKGGTLEFIGRDRGHKGGDYFSERRLLNLGHTPQWIDEFCANHPSPHDWEPGNEGRFLREDAVMRALSGPRGQKPALESECQEALEHYGKKAEAHLLKSTRQFAVVVAFWHDEKGLTPSQICERLQTISSPKRRITAKYPFSAKERKALRERVKKAIERGRAFLTTLD